MSKHARETTGLTPEPSRKMKKDVSDEEEPQLDSEVIQTLQDLQQEMASTRVQTSYLLGQQADNQRERAKKEFLVGESFRMLTT